MDKTDLLKEAESELSKRLTTLERVCARDSHYVANIYLERYYGAVSILYVLDLIPETDYPAWMEAGLQRYMAAQYPMETK